MKMLSGCLFGSSCLHTQVLKVKSMLMGLSLSHKTDLVAMMWSSHGLEKVTTLVTRDTCGND